MIIHKVEHSINDVDKLNVSEKEGERGLASELRKGNKSKEYTKKG